MNIIEDKSEKSLSTGRGHLSGVYHDFDGTI
jgi:hypothetical protein